MTDWDNPITDYWLKYYLDPESGLCTLCWNKGKIITVKDIDGQLPRTAHVDYCICPNGQSMRKNSDAE
jgi:hypothetical protein